MLYVTKRVEFSASHRLFNPTFSDERNDEVFDKCNNFFGHGHNYVLEVTVCGLPNPETGYVIDLKKLKRIINYEIVDKVDHKHLNYDVAFLKGIIPTAENIVVTFWKLLENKIDDGKLFKMRLYESEDSYVEYFGDSVNIPLYLNSESK